MGLIPARDDDTFDIISLLLRRVDELERMSASRWGASVPGPWHYIGAAGEPAFTNSWVNRGGTTRTSRFRIERDVVRLEGGISTGATGTTAFTLPVGFRPPLEVVASIRVSDGGTELLAFLFITAAGAVSVNAVGSAGGINAADFFVTFATS